MQSTFSWVVSLALVMLRPKPMTADAQNGISVKKGWQLTSTSVPTCCPSLPLPGVPCHPGWPSLVGLQEVNAGKAGCPVSNHDRVQVALHDHSHGQVVLAVGHPHQLTHTPIHARHLRLQDTHDTHNTQTGGQRCDIVPAVCARGSYRHVGLQIVCEGNSCSRDLQAQKKHRRVQGMRATHTLSLLAADASLRSLSVAWRTPLLADSFCSTSLIFPSR